MTFEGLQIQGAIKIMEKLTVSKVSFHRSEIGLLINYTIYLDVYPYPIHLARSIFLRAHQKVLL